MSVWYPVKKCYESSPGHQRKGDWTEQLPIAHVHWPCQGHKFWSWENQFAFLSRLSGMEPFSLSWCRWRTATLMGTVGSGLLGKVLSSSDWSMNEFRKPGGHGGDDASILGGGKSDPRAYQWRSRNAGVMASWSLFLLLLWKNKSMSHLEQVVLDIVEKLEGETPRKGHRTTIEHAGFFTHAQVLRIHITSNVSSSYNNFQYLDLWMPTHCSSLISS